MVFLLNKLPQRRQELLWGIEDADRN